MNQTSRYKLNQWDPEDRILREDFNADNAKLETALGGLNTSVRKHTNQLLGVPILGRHLYNLFLQQKKAGQDVSWMQNLLYDDFTDQSKIESLSELVSWSPTEKCLLLNPTDDQLDGQLVTKPQRMERSCSYAFLWVRYSLANPPVVEFHSNSPGDWVPMEKLPIPNFWTVNAEGEESCETYYYMPMPQNGYYLNIRFTFTAYNITSQWPMKVYDYGCLLI